MLTPLPPNPAVDIEMARLIAFCITYSFKDKFLKIAPFIVNIKSPIPSESKVVPTPGSPIKHAPATICPKARHPIRAQLFHFIGAC